MLKFKNGLCHILDILMAPFKSTIVVYRGKKIQDNCTYPFTFIAFG